MIQERVNNMNDKYIINNITSADLNILDREGIAYSVIDINYNTPHNYNGVTYKIRIIGHDDNYYHMALYSLRRM
jgi:hypothetical protein